ncbi:Uncharacterised protein [Vibrio owensii]|uniref:hypothetical protein n=1 Tax=Vibrio owensii TaxID=696485 RepID=UPI00039D06D8|nr:hypothetical protein [Vibrio owensii]SUP93042.1 Uncharacterised protein [Vibrio owensii]
MNNFKKAALASLVFAGMAIGSAQAADPTATLTWTGIVPDSNAGDTLLITGQGGSLEIQNGTITAQADGTFTSSSIVVEARTNTSGDAANPVVGDLADATWSVQNPTITYGGTFDPTLNENLIVFADGVQVTDNSDILGAQASTVSLAVGNDTPVADVEGGAVQASITVVASTI